MLRIVGVELGQRCRLNRLISLRQISRHSCQSIRSNLSPLDPASHQCRNASTLPASASSSINIAQTDTSSLTSLPSGSNVTLAGWITSKRRISKNLSFAVLLLPRGQGRVQLIARSEEGGAEDDANVAIWDNAGNNGVVLVQGELHHKPSKDQRPDQEKVRIHIFFGKFQLTVHSTVESSFASGNAHLHHFHTEQCSQRNIAF